MSPRPPGAGRAGVVVLAEQLRRAVPGGIGTYVTGLARGLDACARQGDLPFPVHLYASRPARRPDPLAGLGLPVDTSRLPGAVLVRAWAAGAGIGRRAAAVQATSLAIPGGRDPLVVTVHDLCWRRFPDAYPPRGRAWHEAALRRAARRAAAFVVPAAAVAGDLVGAGIGVGEDRVHVVEHGADHLPPADDRGAGAVLARLGVAGPFLLAVGTLEPRKNLPRLVTGYERARPRLPEPWPLVVVGPPGWGGTLADRVPAGVLLAGPVAPGALAGLYAAARVCAYVPLGEGFGLPVLEAMAAGTPVVASEVPASGGAALTVDPLDPDAIAEALVTVATDEAVRARLVAAGADRARGRTWAASAAAHVRLWEAVAHG